MSLLGTADRVYSQRTATTACSKYDAQWDCYLPRLIWAYRNVPHEKPSFLLFRVDCRSPTVAALIPSQALDPEDSDYREQFLDSFFFSARFNRSTMPSHWVVISGIQIPNSSHTSHIRWDSSCPPSCMRESLGRTS